MATNTHMIDMCHHFSETETGIDIGSRSPEKNPMPSVIIATKQLDENLALLSIAFGGEPSSFRFTSFLQNSQRALLSIAFSGAPSSFRFTSLLQNSQRQMIRIIQVVHAGENWWNQDEPR